MKQSAFTLMVLVVVLSPRAAVCQGREAGTVALPDAPDFSSPAQISTQPGAQPSSQAVPQTSSHPDTPPSPQPAPQVAPQLSDAAWRQVQRIPYGTYVRVSGADGDTQECNFAGATDTALFCDDPGDLQGAGYKFDRDYVAGVKKVRPRVDVKPQHDRHWGKWIAAGVVGTMVATRSGTKTASGRAMEGAIAGTITFEIGELVQLTRRWKGL